MPLGKFTPIKPQLAGLGPAVAGPASAMPSAAGLLVGVVFREGGLKTQAVVRPFSASDVSHLVLKVFALPGASESPVRVDGKALEIDVASASAQIPVTITGLPASPSYRVRAYAYAAPGTSSAALISTEGSFVDVALEPGSTVSATLSIQLGDRAFAGVGTSSISITDGPVTDAPQESID